MCAMCKTLLSTNTAVQVVPIPASLGLSCTRSLENEVGRLDFIGQHGARPVWSLRSSGARSSTTEAEATSPPTCPPMPSATTAGSGPHRWSHRFDRTRPTSGAGSVQLKGHRYAFSSITVLLMRTGVPGSMAMVRVNWLPCTKVPLVEPRSSKNQRLPCGKSLACRPEA